MRQVFRPRGFFRVADGTDVSPFLNATDAKQTDVPWGCLGDVSIAAGRIEPGVESRIHVHPLVTQVTYVCHGHLTLRMQEPTETAPYSLEVQAGEAVVTRPRTWFQLSNTSAQTAEVLYIVSPSFVFEAGSGGVLYSDAAVVGDCWRDPTVSEAVAVVATDQELRAARAAAVRRLAARRGVAPPDLRALNVSRRPPVPDCRAPDGAEIRRMADGPLGGLAHYRLPANRCSAAVRHRSAEELWYVVAGFGEVWRSLAGIERTDCIRGGDSLRIPADCAFQFRAGTDADLDLVIATMPAWPGAGEPAPVSGRWTT